MKFLKRFFAILLALTLFLAISVFFYLQIFPREKALLKSALNLHTLPSGITELRCVWRGTLDVLDICYFKSDDAAFAELQKGWPFKKYTTKNCIAATDRKDLGIGDEVIFNESYVYQFDEFPHHNVELCRSSSGQHSALFLSK